MVMEIAENEVQQKESKRERVAGMGARVKVKELKEQAMR